MHTAIKGIHLKAVLIFFFVIFPLLRSICSVSWIDFTVWKVSKYGVFSGPYFPVFSSNTGKYGPEKNPYLNSFHAVFKGRFFQLLMFRTIY